MGEGGGGGIQFRIVYIQAMHGITVPSRTDVDTNILPLVGREPVQHAVVQHNERLQQPAASPWIPRVILQR